MSGSGAKTAPRVRARGATGRRSRYGLTLHQLRYDLRVLLRNRQAQFFTLFLPVVLLVTFASVIGGPGSTVAVSGGRLPTATSYVPAIMTVAVIASTFVNLVISVTAQRESGVLRRRRATPLPATVLIVSRALASFVVALSTCTVLIVVGWAAYGAHLSVREVPSLIVSLVVGAASFCCIGFAVASLVRDQDSAQPVTQAVMLPMYFVSGVFVAASMLPHWLLHVADVFPVRHLEVALLTVYNPHLRSAGPAYSDLLIVAGWGAGGLLLALRKFSWQPRGR